MSGLSPKLPLQIDSEDGYRLNKEYKEMIQQNLKSIILTVPGERIMYPNFGVGMRQYLFEQPSVTLYVSIGNRIKEQVKRWLPFVTLENIRIMDNVLYWDSNSGIQSNITGQSEIPDNAMQVSIFWSAQSINISSVLNIEIQ